MEIDRNNLKCDICNKMYKTTSGLWKHKKKCEVKNEKNKKHSHYK